MAFSKMRKLGLISALSIAAPMSYALDFVADGIPYVQYGDGHSYSLPISQLLDGCKGPGCDYYVNSTPGAIKELIVLGTGSSGKPVTTNYYGMDGAYATPNSSGENFFSTPVAPDPDDNNDNDINHDYDETWDATLLSMQTFLDGEEILFFFNNNQEKSDGTAAESLAVWAQVWITDTAGNLVGVVYEFANDGYDNTGINPYGLVSEGGGGAVSLLGGDATLYDSGITDPLNFDPEAGTVVISIPGVGDVPVPATDYVLSGGAICLDLDNILGPLPVSCSNPAADTPPIDHNLGANEAAYAVSFPELNLALAGFFGSLTDLQLADYTLHVDFRFGCDHDLYGTDPEAVICKGGDHGKNINNGFEQLFIGTTESVTHTPVPATLALFGLGLLGLGVIRRRA